MWPALIAPLVALPIPFLPDMLAYRHSFHAGNHADVLKHLVLVAVLNYMNEKDKPYWVIDTHAGAGMYSLESVHAQRNAEHEFGVSKLAQIVGSADTGLAVPALVSQYLEIVMQANPRSDKNALLSAYPGSPSISEALLRESDKLRLFELHPSDFDLLRTHFRGQRGVSMQHIDGFAGLKASLPPPPRRAVVLIDPSYELKEDYALVGAAIQDSLQRFAQGVYLVWYPMLTRPEWWRMVERLEKLPVPWLNVAMEVAEPDVQGFGMLGSGMFMINPPWVLEAQMRELMPFLVKTLGQFAKASFSLKAGVRRS